MFRAIRTDQIKAQNILGGPIKVVVDSETVGSKNLMFALGIFEPGQGLVPHEHPESEEVYYVISGAGTVYIGKDRREEHIKPETALFIPPGTIHSVANTGKQKLTIAFFVAPGKETPKQAAK